MDHYNAKLGTQGRWLWQENQGHKEGDSEKKIKQVHPSVTKACNIQRDTKQKGLLEGISKDGTAEVETALITLCDEQNLWATSTCAGGYRKI